MAKYIKRFFKKTLKRKDVSALATGSEKSASTMQRVELVAQHDDTRTIKLVLAILNSQRKLFQ